MLTQKQYEEARKGDRLVTCRPIGNRFIRVPAGTKVTVLGKYAGLTLLAEACEDCGAQAEFSRVSRFDVSFPGLD